MKVPPWQPVRQSVCTGSYILKSETAPAGPAKPEKGFG